MSAASKLPQLPQLPELPMLSGKIAPLSNFPERAIQFGTGALLRGLVDALLDDANRAGRFGGRVVAVGSTGSGRDETINLQQGLFTLRVQGITNGLPVSESRVIGSLSRALSAAGEWGDVLECARNPALEVVFSNTTEVGIALDDEDDNSTSGVPRSFPAKLTRFLHERARAFSYGRDKGVVVIPCELIDRNGDTLRDLVLAQAERWKLGAAFTSWVEESVRFCNTLVDRIVTGTPPRGGEEQARLEKELGYRDAMLTVCEPYRLLVIEGDDALRARLPFARTELGVAVVDDVTPYRERKVRLLNGGHTAVVSLALLAGCETVREAAEHPRIGRFLRRALFEEIVPAMRVDGAEPFAREVLDRFVNPYIRHSLRDITLHGGTKMRVRVVPSIIEYAERMGHPPASLALGFAAYLLYTRNDARSRAATAGGNMASPPDQLGDRIGESWRSRAFGADESLLPFVRAVCGDVALWGVNLDAMPGFSALVANHLQLLDRRGAEGALIALEEHVRTDGHGSRTPALA